MTIIFTVLFLTLAFTAGAQEYADIIRDNSARAASNLYHYEYEATDLTPAPKGYRPFYILHYGRHGSRYMSSNLEADAVRPVFEAADSMGLLTEKGRLFWQDLKAVLDEQEGMTGMLTSRGARELRGIGGRMARNFPEVFDGKSGRNVVNSVSSTSPRCLLSMTCFTDALAEVARGLEFSYVTGLRHYAYLAYHLEVQEGLELSGKKEMAFRRAESDPEALFRQFFTDSDRLSGCIGDPYVFERRLYQLSCVGHLTDHGKCLLEYFPEDLLIRNWEARNARFYVAYANSKELPYYATEVAAPLMSEMLDRIEAALEADSDVAADLSFGHDVTLMPLISHIGIEGMHELLSFEEVNGKWDSADFICMGSNLQMIFYRNRSGDVIVKLLYNEQEKTVPAVEAYDGPYYRWNDLKAVMTVRR